MSDDESLRCPACRKQFAREAQLNKHRKDCQKMKKINMKALSIAASVSSRTPFLPNIRKRSRSSRHDSEEDRPNVKRPHAAAQPTESGSSGRRMLNDGESHVERDIISPPFLPLHVPDPFPLNMNIDSPHAPAEPEVAPSGKRKSKPSARLLASVRDILPVGPGELLEPTSRLLATVEGDKGPPETPVSQPARSLPRRVVLYVHEHWKTTKNKFQTWREYRRKPTSIPDLCILLSDLTNTTEEAARPKKHRKLADIIFPYPNVSSFLFAHHYRSGSDRKTKGDRKQMQSLLGDPRFRQEDIAGVNFDRIDEDIAEDVQSPWGGNGWSTTDIKIRVPTGIKQKKAVKQQRQREKQAAIRHDEVDPDLDDDTPALLFDVKGLRHRSLIHILRSTVQDPVAQKFHWHSYEEQWQPPFRNDMDSEKVYGELYSSTAFCDAERNLLASPPEEGCNLPRVIAAYMFWSDATHVTQFGDSKLWPVYLFFGNQSKYDRVKPSARSAHHVAFIPSLPDHFTDFLAENNVNATQPLLTFCRRELFHGVWQLLLDEEFMHAYKHGVVLKCADGITRRVYPRIFTYSADYPEKVLIATVRDMGGCPCPRCKMPLEKVRGLGTTADRQARRNGIRLDNDNFRKAISAARNIILKDGYAVNSDKVDNLLKAESLVPTENAFSAKISREFGSSVFAMLVVDYLHEFELGVWKAVVSHLIRILESLGRNKVNEFDKRYREVPAFGRETIRCFSHNVSELKKLGARDFEDILICSMPCFEGLLPEPFDSYVSDMLYIMNLWAGLAKLRMHTDSSVDALDIATTALGNVLRHFADITCNAFAAYETDSEYQKRKRNEARRKQKTAVGPSKGKATDRDGPGKRRKTFNLSTSKVHTLGDYPSTIRMFGTIESYSTQAGELQHRVVKNQYAQTSKNNVLPQMVKLDVMETVHRRMAIELEEYYQMHLDTPESESEDESQLPLAANLEVHHCIAKDQSRKLYFNEFEAQHPNDPAYKDFERKLRKYIFLQLKEDLLPEVSEAYKPSPEDLSEIMFEHDRFYEHSTLAINYTTYDIRREQDTINPGTGRKFILVNPGNQDAETHPFWYARVLGLFHANVFLGHSTHQVKAQRFDFLWVRWFSRDTEKSGGSRTLRLDRVEYVSQNDSNDAFGFVNPSQVVRGCHLIPAFSLGRTTSLLSPSKHRDSLLGDWTKYYVNRFVDRDMLMHYLGLGVGHLKPKDYPRDLEIRRDILVENNETSWVNLDDVLPEGMRPEPFESDFEEEDSEDSSG